MVPLKRQAGFGTSLIIYAVLIAGAAAGVYAVVHTYNSAIEKAAEMEKQRDIAFAQVVQAEKDKEILKARGEAAAIRHQAELERLAGQHENQMENRDRADRATSKASEDKIAATLQRDHEKYAGFINKALPRNLEALECRSDLRTVNDEKRCPITIH